MTSITNPESPPVPLARNRILIRAYIAAVCAGAVAASIRLAPEGLWSHVGTLACLMAAGAAAGAWPVRLPNVRVQFTVSHPVILCVLGTLGPGPALLAAAAGVVGATAPRRRRATVTRFVFNLGAQTLAAGLAGATFLVAGGTAGEPLRDLLLPLLAATTILFLADNGLVALVIAMDHGKPFRTVWNDSFRWSAVSYYSGLSFASAIIQLYESLGVVGFALGIAPVWMLVSFFRIQKRWQAEHMSRVEQAEQVNRVLEWKVEERTRELQAALSQVEDTNRKLVGANEALTEASKAKSEFLAGVSHELRTPLNAIIGFSEVLAAQDTEGLSGRQREFLRAIHDGGDHLLSLINDILHLSRIESGSMPLNLDVMDVSATVTEVVSMLRGQAEDNELELVAELGEGLGAVSVDPRLFREILLNLLSNAIKFTPAGGRVRVLANVEGDGLVLQVVDTGVGIAPEDHERIFERFYQVDGTYTRKFRGTGLGLGLVQRMVEMHGGTVAVDSSPGRGATFTCRFPDCRVALPRDPGKQVSPILSEGGACSPWEPPRTDQRTVLVVDPDPLNRRLAVNALKTKNHRVLELADLGDVLATVRSQQVDLALIALNDDIPAGFGLAVAIRQEPSARGVALVALAGPDVTDPSILQKAGFDGLIAAPVRIHRLPQQVRSYLERKEHVA